LAAALFVKYYIFSCFYAEFTLKLKFQLFEYLTGEIYRYRMEKETTLEYCQ